ncbi:LON peptidase N-terminal domain and RING finger protein 3-like isoform X2 [Hydractinia symbiolongicarpus]|uniref:LON peptidase N-terminal domain and RING finger protein 3-like isoform X2 n=1 Tax=Hydractinia symbiolongicarpus TaxID=13093 RepID=UPI002551BC25|nr:LON peptidase N-terminal domain and RING finger protein 3-like isoform X2 [Hydractinia symbiolongicarpus]
MLKLHNVRDIKLYKMSANRQVDIDIMGSITQINNEFSARELLKKVQQTMNYNGCIDSNVMYLLTTSFNKQIEENGCFKSTSEKDDIKSFFVCLICSDILTESTTLPCGHTFCLDCVKKRESASFAELCFVCDNEALKRKKWFYKNTGNISHLCTDVTLCSIIQKCYSNELTASKQRKEGNALFSLQCYKEAEMKYMQSITLVEESYLSWSNLSNLKAKLGLYEEALAAAKKATAISPFWCKGYYREGVALNGLQKYYDSSVSFLKYLILEPTSLAVRELLVESLVNALKIENDSDDFNWHSDDKIDGCLSSVDKLMKWLISAGVEFCSSLSSDKQKDVSSNMEGLLEQIQQEITCPLCFRILYQPTTTCCGHSFCTECLERSLDHSSVCSICRCSLNNIITVKPKPINRTIQALLGKFFQSELTEREVEFQLEAHNLSYEDAEETTVPIFICSLSLPALHTSLHIFEPRYKLMIRRCLESDVKMFGMCLSDDQDGFADCGTLLEIISNRTLNDGRLLINTIGRKRFKVVEKGRKDGYCTARVSWISDENITEEKDSVRHNLKETYDASKVWLDGLSFLLSWRIKLEFGSLPPFVDEELETSDGPIWVWWMIRLLFAGSMEESLQALASTSVQMRAGLIRKKLESFNQH